MIFFRIRLESDSEGSMVDTARLNYKRAIATFISAYVVVTILGIALSIGIAIVEHIPETAEPMDNQAYLLAERFYPWLNLVVWAIFAWVYFRRRKQNASPNLREEAFVLGAFWLTAAVVVDYVGFVLIKNPISLSPHDFYIGQAPWIYLIYLAILIAPFCWIKLGKSSGSDTTS
jgi:hypothetical protein